MVSQETLLHLVIVPVHLQGVCIMALLRTRTSRCHWSGKYKGNRSSKISIFVKPIVRCYVVTSSLQFLEVTEIANLWADPDQSSCWPCPPGSGCYQSPLVSHQWTLAFVICSRASEPAIACGSQQEATQYHPECRIYAHPGTLLFALHHQMFQQWKRSKILWTNISAENDIVVHNAVYCTFAHAKSSSLIVMWPHNDECLINPFLDS